jgi:hypothetical protein
MYINLKVYFQNYEEVEDCMTYIWDDSIDDENQKIINDSISYFEEKIKLE